MKESLDLGGVLNSPFQGGDYRYLGQVPEIVVEWLKILTQREYERGRKRHAQSCRKAKKSEEKNHLNVRLS